MSREKRENGATSKNYAPICFETMREVWRF
jgi:hypothetical protein